MIRLPPKLPSLIVALVAAIFGGVPAGAWHHCGDGHEHGGSGCRPAEIASHTHCDHNHGDASRVAVDCGACVNSFASSFPPPAQGFSLEQREAFDSREATECIVLAAHFESHPARGPPLA